MIQSNVLSMPARRRSDPPVDQAPERRSSPAFAGVHVYPPMDEPFADSIIAAERQAREERMRVKALERMNKALEDHQLRLREVTLAERHGFEAGRKHGWKHAWWTGICLGIVIGASVVALALKAGAVLGGQ